MKKNPFVQKKMAKLVCVVLLLSLTACGGQTPSSTVESSASAPSSSAINSASESEPSSAPSAELEQPTAKVSYTDFYKEVNQDWFAENPLEEDVPYISCDEEARELVLSRIAEMFENTSPDDFSEEDPMRKMALFYQQLREEGAEKEASMARIKQLLDTIESQKNLKQFYQNILMDPVFSNFNTLMSVNYMPCMDHRYRVHYYPRPLSFFYFEKTEEEIQVMTDSYRNMLSELGYAPQDALSMAQNAMKLDGMIWDLLCAEHNGLVLYREDDEELQGCTFPFIDIQKALGYELYITSARKEYSFFATETYYAFIQELFTPENLQMIKDYYAICALERLCPVGSMDLNLLYAEIQFKFMGIYEYEYERPELSMLNTAAILEFDDGVVNKWYADKYVSDTQKAEVLALVNDINTEMQEIIEAIPWTTPKSKRAVKMKIDSLRYFLGCYDEYNPLTGVEIGTTCVDTLLSLLGEQRTYNQVFLQGGGLHDDTSSANLSTVNAYYLEDSAGIAICNGMLAKMESQEPDATYEEKLGLMGAIIAHEVAHTIDDNNFYLDRHLIRAEWFDDAHREGLYSTITPVYELCNQITTEYGNAIDGASTYNETYCDLVAMKCCLQILSKRENANYDSFFQAYAKQNAIITTPAYEKLWLKSDYHLPDHERVNYVLAQFDEFYNTYEIAEDSPYYVPKAKRIILFP